MTHQEVLTKIKPEFELTQSAFKEELMKIRSSRLTPAFIEDIEVNCFGSFLPLKQLGAISSNGLRELVVQLWDKSYVEGVVAAVENAGLGLSMRIDDKTIYFSAPPLTEETRHNLIQLLNKQKEEFFQQLRRVRDKAWKELQDLCSQGVLREDDKFKGRDKLDEMARDFKEKLEEMSQNKEKEIKG